MLIQFLASTTHNQGGNLHFFFGDSSAPHELPNSNNFGAFNIHLGSEEVPKIMHAEASSADLIAPSNASALDKFDWPVFCNL